MDVTCSIIVSRLCILLLLMIHNLVYLLTDLLMLMTKKIMLFMVLIPK